jgi:hypothetical protein
LWSGFGRIFGGLEHNLKKIRANPPKSAKNPPKSAFQFAPHLLPYFETVPNSKMSYASVPK